MLHWAQVGLSIAEANRDGQQLFFANMHQTPQRSRGAYTQKQQRFDAAKVRAAAKAAPHRRCGWPVTSNWSCST